MSVSWFLSCLPQYDDIRVSTTLFDAYARTHTDQDLLPILDSVRSGILEDTTTSTVELNLKASNGDVVNGIHFKGTEDKAIIWLHGNGCFYETSHPKPLHWRNSLQRKDQIPHLIVFNPRGTGQSTGRTQLSFVIEDIELMFKHLISLGVNPCSVVIGGHSMGGYFTLFGAAELQNKYPESTINFISDRSIWNLKSRVSIKVKAAGYSGFSESLFSSYVNEKLSSPDWSRDSLPALESLRGRILIIYHQKDGVVLFEDSTYQGLCKAKRNREYNILELCENDPHQAVDSYPHNREFTDDENAIIITEIGRMLGIHSDSTKTSLLNPNQKI